MAWFPVPLLGGVREARGGFAGPLALRQFVGAQSCCAQCAPHATRAGAGERRPYRRSFPSLGKVEYSFFQALEKVSVGLSNPWKHEHAA